jgi:large subunit ribosomal protein L34
MSIVLSTASPSSCSRILRIDHQHTYLLAYLPTYLHTPPPAPPPILTDQTPRTKLTLPLPPHRTFTSLPSLRPRLGATSSVFRPAKSTPLFTPTTTAETTGILLDLVPRGAVTAHPAALAQQVRFGPRATMARTSRLVRKRRHGFLSRVRTRTGRRTLQHRRGKGRHTLSN